MVRAERELEQRPLTSIFTREEYSRLEAAAGAETCLEAVYSSTGVRVRAYVVLPSELRRPWPTILFARGGNRDFGSIGPLTLR